MNHLDIRNSHRRCSLRKSCLKSFAKFLWKHLCRSLFFNKVAGLRPATLLKTRLRHWCLPVNFAKFLRHLIRTVFKNTSGSMLLGYVYRNTDQWRFLGLFLIFLIVDTKIAVRFATGSSILIFCSSMNKKK